MTFTLIHPRQMLHGAGDTDGDIHLRLHCYLARLTDLFGVRSPARVHNGASCTHSRSQPIGETFNILRAKPSALPTPRPPETTISSLAQRDARALLRGLSSDLQTTRSRKIQIDIKLFRSNATRRRSREDSRLYARDDDRTGCFNGLRYAASKIRVVLRDEGFAIRFQADDIFQ